MLFQLLLNFKKVHSCRITLFKFCYIFQVFSLHSGGLGDSFTVYDGSTNTSAILWQYSESNLPPDIIESSNNHMFVQFHSDHSNVGELFNFTYQQKGMIMISILKKCFDP